MTQVGLRRALEAWDGSSTSYRLAESGCASRLEPVAQSELIIGAIRDERGRWSRFRPNYIQS